MTYFIEAVFFSIVMFVGQGLAAYILPEAEFVDVINFFFILSFSRSVFSSLVLEPMLGAHERGEHVFDYLFCGVCVLIFLNILPVLYFFEDFHFLFKVFVILSFLFDAIFMFTRRVNILTNRIWPLVSLYASMFICFLLFFFSIQTAFYYLIIYASSLSFSLILIYRQYISNDCELFHNWHFDFNVIIYKILSLRIFYSVINNISFFLFGSFYLFFYQMLQRDDFLVFCKVMVLYQAPLLVLSGALSNFILSGQMQRMRKRVFLFFTVVTTSILLAVIGYFLMPQNLLNTQDFLITLNLMVGIVFFSSSNALMGVTISPMRRDGRLSLITKFLIPSLIFALFLFILLFLFFPSPGLPFIVSTIFFGSMIVMVNLRENNSSSQRLD